MSAIDKIKDHYNALDNATPKVVEEWGLTIYKQPINLEKKGRLFDVVWHTRSSTQCYYSTPMGPWGQGPTDCREHVTRR